MAACRGQDFRSADHQFGCIETETAWSIVTTPL